MDLRLQGRRALVSGSAAGIGRAIAAGLAGEGASVIVNGRAQSSVDRAVAELKAATGGDVVGFAGDLSAATAADEIAHRHPDVEILVNNLAIFEPKPFEEIADADWVRFFETNVLSGIRLARLFLPAMKRADWGRIIFISSESALQIPGRDDPLRHDQDGPDRGCPRPGGIGRGHGHYGEQHSAGADQVSRSCRVPRCLGQGRGQDRAEVEAEFFEKVRPTSLIKRFATVEEVASLVTYIASPLASATTGAALRVDGGVVKSAF